MITSGNLTGPQFWAADGMSPLNDIRDSDIQVLYV